MKDFTPHGSPLDPPPSYTESVVASSSSNSFTPTIPKTHFNAISSLLTTYIHPHLYRSALDGFSTRTLLLIPSNVSTLHPLPIAATDPSAYINPFQESTYNNAFTNETIIGFPSTENLLLIRLHGDANTLEFWRQDCVIQNLQTQLKADLNDAGYQVVERSHGEAMHQSVRANLLSSDMTRWRLVSEQALGNGEVRVGIEIRDVSLRMESILGLYETRGGKAVVIKVEFGP